MLLAELKKDMLGMAAQQEGLQLAIDSASKLPRTLRADAGKLRQVRINLLSSAIKFTYEGGITLHVRQTITITQPDCRSR